MQGPPPSEAGPSSSNTPREQSSQSTYAATPPGQAMSVQTYPAGTFSQFSVYDRASPVHTNTTPNTSQGYASYAPMQTPPLNLSHTVYPNYAPDVQERVQGWPAGYSPYGTPSYAPYHTAPLKNSSAHARPTSIPTLVPSKPRSPSPPPPPPFKKHWDGVIKTFLHVAGLTQALRGFEDDILVMNEDFESSRIPVALDALQKDLQNLSIADVPVTAGEQKKSLDERKLEHTHHRPDVEPRTPTTITKTISRFLAQNRARNDASNRQEFLLSLAEKRQRAIESGGNTDPGPSCARTDAKTQDREIQMKYDIAKNEEGPLRKTMKKEQDLDVSMAKAKLAKDQDGVPTAERHPALDERISNIETHVAVRYVPSPPRSLLDRIKFLEDHLIHLEKEYPSWAALHFNQPRRGWPPPPRPTPIIVPSHLTSSAVSETDKDPAHAAESSISTPPLDPNSSKLKGKSSKNNVSSLHRAVMERLEVQKAMKDLESVKTEPEQ